MKKNVQIVSAQLPGLHKLNTLCTSTQIKKQNMPSIPEASTLTPLHACLPLPLRSPLTLLTAARLGFASLKVACLFRFSDVMWASHQDKPSRCIFLFSLHNSPPICVLTSPLWYRRRNEEATTESVKMLVEPSLARSRRARQTAETSGSSR